MQVSVLGTGLLGSKVAPGLDSRGVAVSAWKRTAHRAGPLPAFGIALPGAKVPGASATRTAPRRTSR
jgi:3-hydroxyisobutyrate dehydrogenase-like beta-hydroxyacid dehydrogenase